MNNKEFENDDFDYDDLEDCDLNMLFGKLADLENTENMFSKKEVQKEENFDLGNDMSQLETMANAFSSMNEIMSLGKIVESDCEERDLTESEKSEEEEKASKAYNDMMKRLGSLETLGGLEMFNQFIDEDEE